MKKNDLIFILAVAVLFLPFVFIKPLFAGFEWATAHHPFIMSFLKFGILATLGEMLGLRIRTGSYNAPGFGALPRAITWGFLGMMINAGFIIFGSGSYNILLTLGIGFLFLVPYWQAARAHFYAELKANDDEVEAITGGGSTDETSGQQAL